MLEKVVHTASTSVKSVSHTLGVSVSWYVSLSKLWAGVCCFLHFLLLQMPDTLHINTSSLSELKPYSLTEVGDDPLIQVSLCFSCTHCSHTDMCSSLSNMSKNVSGRIRIGWTVSGLMLVTDVWFLLAELSVTLLTFTISL